MDWLEEADHFLSLTGWSEYRAIRDFEKAYARKVMDGGLFDVYFKARRHK